MMFTPAPELWLPQRRGLVDTIATLEAGKSVCLYAPTGGGKSKVASELMRWGLSENRLGIFYINRRLLIPQTAEAFDKAGLNYGIRAAGYDDCLDHFAPIQIASADTEASRVFSDSPSWEPHPAKLVVIDEGHLMKTQVIRKVIDYYKSQGAYIVMLTATPVGLSKWVDCLVTSGKLQEYRDAGALVPAKVYCISMPDMAKVKRNLTGEFILDGKAKQVFTQTIVTDVIESYKDLNPNAEPTMLFAPGVAESIWFTEQFSDAGYRFCHIDANDYVLDGKRGALNRKAWAQIFDDFRDGKIQGLSCRFRLREGVNAPFAKHAIFATPIGSLASWIQAAGRVLRSAPGKTEAIIQDHGGCLDTEAEVLTDIGWVGWQGVSAAKNVAAYNRETGSISWEPILQVHHRELGPGEEMYELKNSRVDIRVTGNHRLLFQQRTADSKGAAVWPSQYKLKRIDSLVGKARMKMPISGCQDGDEVALSDDELSFIGWWLTDGTVAGKRAGIAISQSEHQPQLAHLVKALQGCGFDYRIYRTKAGASASGYTSRHASLRFAIPRGNSKAKPRRGWGRLAQYIDKDFPVALLNISSRQFEILLHAIHLGDGAKDRSSGTYKICSGNKLFADRLQSLAVRRGWKCNISVSRAGRKSDLYTLNMQKRDSTVFFGTPPSVRHLSIERCPSTPGEIVWCVSNKLETLIVRRNGKVAIIGNSYHRFGSPNHDQPWDRLWDLPERAASEYHRLSIADGSKPEPICCPSCKMERARGSKCPGCGFECDRSKRKVVMENGKMIEVDGPLMKPRRAVMKKDTEKKWEQLYWAFKNKGVDRSFNQMWAYFFQQFGYPPPRDMKLCPKDPDGWYRRPSQVPMNELIGKG